MKLGTKKIALTGHNLEIIKNKKGAEQYTKNKLYKVLLRLKELNLDFILMIECKGGVHSWARVFCEELKINYFIIEPCDFNEEQTSKEKLNFRKYMTSKAERIVTVSPGKFTGKKIPIMKNWIIKNCDAALVIYDIFEQDHVSKFISGLEKYNKPYILIKPRVNYPVKEVGMQEFLKGKTQ